MVVGLIEKTGILRKRKIEASIIPRLLFFIQIHPLGAIRPRSIRMHNATIR